MYNHLVRRNNISFYFLYFTSCSPAGHCLQTNVYSRII